MYDKSARILLAFLLCWFLCLSGHGQKLSDTLGVQTNKEKTSKKFDQKLWREKEGFDYIYRDQMLEDVVYNDTIRSLSKDELIVLLGEPDRTNKGHLYYRITERRIWFWTLHSKTMVIKLSEDAVEWIKIHE